MSDTSFLEALEGVIGRRLEESPEGSYTSHLAAQGTLKVAQKVGEEAVEVVIAAAAQDRAHVVAEAADLLYHLLLLLRLRELRLSDVVAELEARHGARSGPSPRGA
jgi:phosphoribosyl-ATP pyrophosphohydrolase